MTNETIADIAAEKRRIAKEVRDYASNGDYWDRKKANETAEDLEEEADRLEAAHRRERGDCAKLREAAEFVAHIDDNGYTSHDVQCAIDKARAALSAPPRNCDIAQDWLRDLYVNFKPPTSVKREMPPEWVDSVMAFCRWLFAPATEKEGANDGNE